MALKNTILGASALTLLLPVAAFAQKSGGGVVGGDRLRPGNWSNSRSYQSYAPSRSSYRNVAPEVARTERAPEAVAENPTERRSYSYEPTPQSADNASRSGKSDCRCDCGSVESKGSAEGKVEPSADGRRSYSYDPAANDGAVTSESNISPQRNYSTSGPRMQSSRSSSWKSQTGSKMERNNPRN